MMARGGRKEESCGPGGLTKRLVQKGCDIGKWERNESKVSQVE